MDILFLRILFFLLFYHHLWLNQIFFVAFSYNSNIVQDIYITATIKNVSLDDALRELFLETGIKHEIVKEKYIILTNSINDDNQFLLDLCGQLVDSLTNQPLPFANVQLKSAGTGVTSDETGRFVFSDTYSPDDILNVLCTE